MHQNIIYLNKGTAGIKFHASIWMFSVLFLLFLVFPVIGQSSAPAATGMNSTVLEIIQDVRQTNTELADELMEYRQLI